MTRRCAEHERGGVAIVEDEGHSRSGRRVSERPRIRIHAKRSSPTVLGEPAACSGPCGVRRSGTKGVDRKVLFGLWSESEVLLGLVASPRRKMSNSDIPLSRRQQLLVRLRELFAKIDAAFAGNDFDTARVGNREVAALLSQIDPQPSRDDPSRISGVRRHPEATDETPEKSSRRAS